MLAGALLLSSGNGPIGLVLVIRSVLNLTSIAFQGYTSLIVPL
jgi:hypothetical protein